MQNLLVNAVHEQKHKSNAGVSHPMAAWNERAKTATQTNTSQPVNSAFFLETPLSQLTVCQAGHTVAAPNTTPTQLCYMACITLCSACTISERKLWAKLCLVQCEQASLLWQRLPFHYSARPVWKGITTERLKSCHLYCSGNVLNLLTDVYESSIILETVLAAGRRNKFFLALYADTANYRLDFFGKHISSSYG